MILSVFVSVSFFMFLWCQINEYTRLFGTKEYTEFINLDSIHAGDCIILGFAENGHFADKKGMEN